MKYKIKNISVTKISLSKFGTMDLSVSTTTLIRKKQSYL